MNYYLLKTYLQREKEHDQRLRDYNSSDERNAQKSNFENYSKANKETDKVLEEEQYLQ